ncbi:MAG TPA: hypothetical protein VFB36_10840 [Nevskiaceae bacterium]|nr:hypothetical protein [Nevskiaceae bacterium]
MSVLRRVAVTLCCAASVAALAGEYRFEGADVIDLSIYDPLAPLLKSVVEPKSLDRNIAKGIIAAAEVSNEAPGQLPMIDATDKKARVLEQKQIAAESAVVQRHGETLTIKTSSGHDVVFRDRPPPKSQDSDADGEMFVYAGRVGAARYHRIEERFQHDAPGSYLVSPADDQTVFVPNGSYVEQISPDGKWLLSMSPGDTHVLLVVVELAADAPKLALVCRGGEAKYAGPGMFKGWRDGSTFDVVLNPTISIPLRFSLDGEAWRPATPDPLALTRLGYVCKR